MNQNERLNYLVDTLCSESEEYKNMLFHGWDKRVILRSLMNIRMPKLISKDFLEIQDAFLQEETKEKGPITLNRILTIKEAYGISDAYADKLSLWQGDITRLSVDAIVNAANSQMLGCFVPCHKCIDNAIHSAAGLELRHECYEYMKNKKQINSDYDEPTGSAVVTSAYNLPCQYVVHTVGPIVHGKLSDALRKDLKNCYESCLKAAMDKGIRSIAFCCISTGEFHFPNDEAAKIAIDTVKECLAENPKAFERVIFNVFKDIDLGIYENILKNG